MQLLEFVAIAVEAGAGVPFFTDLAGLAAQQIQLGVGIKPAVFSTLELPSTGVDAAACATDSPLFPPRYAWGAAGLISPGMAYFFARAARTFVLSSSDTGQLGLGLGSGTCIRCSRAASECCGLMFTGSS